MPYTIFVRKEGNQIVEIKKIDSPYVQKPSSIEKFLKEVEEIGNIPGLSERIKVDIHQHKMNSDLVEDLGVDYDVDFESKEGYVSLKERMSR